jgi:hypothetical protein
VTWLQELAGISNCNLQRRSRSNSTLAYLTWHRRYDSYRNIEGAWPATAGWSQAEKPLLDSAEADVLSLLDCCYAGSAYTGAGGDRQTYELLAACRKHDNMRMPGPDSFTICPLNALESMLEQPKSPVIVTRLTHSIDILATEGVPHMSWSDRLDNHIGRYIQLAPVKQLTKEEDRGFQQRPPEMAVVHTRFSLDIADLSPAQIDSWARELAGL